MVNAKKEAILSHHGNDLGIWHGNIFAPWQTLKEMSGAFPVLGWKIVRLYSAAGSGGSAMLGPRAALTRAYNTDLPIHRPAGARRPCWNDFST
ncbi:hypothetical protein HH212_21420 [Massilia forsythiae]|uniref:Uncharacterized protein n=1 Tax=Massilia forsythiae TaxID=2728020 RepID=A0A7Z2W026_9BURK|nr:hypothetical protein [Massilia forsythiae]QJE02264.1 hypothetical protein HH212_21420 [Massilia forsythiae]